ncbi:MAG: DEAD/DEAH box helicase [Opitutae bacterium]|nr:DEAD/DEAH box helicase [Opitutae bacterium]
MPFSSLGLDPALVRAVAARDYAAPTPIQTQAIPAVLAGRDVMASAQTGSGKTAAFVLPLLQRLSAVPISPPLPVRALILVPTRELAAQVDASIASYGGHLRVPLKTVVAFGGVSINPQMMALRGGADLVVATPGRLLDLVDHNAVRLSRVETVVLDEADQLLNLGFADELARIVGLLPARRQNLLFSATFPPAVETLVAQLLRDPVRLQAEAAPTQSSAPVASIQQRAIEVDRPRRTQLLRHLIQTHGWSRVLVFVATKYTAGHVADKLQKAGLRAEPFHGELSQGARTANLAAFQAGQLQVLVATDVAARGLHIAELPAVVNYDLPRSPTDYVHRVGRTGRAGESGVAISFVTADTHAHFRLIEKRHGLQLEREQIAGFEPVELEVPTPNPTGGIKGKRPNKKDKLRAKLAAQQNPDAPVPSAPPPSASQRRPLAAPPSASRPKVFNVADEPKELFPLVPRVPFRPRRR